MTELFKNTADALLFAFRYSSQQYAMSPMAKMMKAGLVPSGKGLVSTDGAGQAGLIRAAVERLGHVDPLYKACIVARYSVRHKDCPCCGSKEMLVEEYALAISALQHAAAGRGIVTGLSIAGMREIIVRRYFENGISIAKEAERMRVPKRTAYDQKDKIWKWLKDLDSQAQGLIDDMLNPETEGGEAA